MNYGFLEGFLREDISRLVPHTIEDNYVNIMKGGGCYSPIGRVGGKQDLSLGRNCVYPGIVIHEFMHAVG